MTMVERVARAICPLDPDGDTERVDGNRWYRPGIPYWQSWTGEARAAIEAMREPSEAMLEAGDHGTSARGWAAMIDVALAEKS